MRVLACLLIALALAACAAQPTPYQPRRPGQGGFAEAQLDPTTWRVEFSGNAATSRDSVKNALIYRAAEIARDAGYDRFAVLEQVIEPAVRLYATPVVAPVWRARRFIDRAADDDDDDRRRRRVRAWPVPSVVGYRYQPIVRYDGRAIVRLLPPDASAGASAVFRTDEILDALGPRLGIAPAG